MNAWPAVVVLILSALLVPPFLDESARGFNRIYPWNETESTNVYIRSSEFFECNGLKCHGWLYRPLSVPEPRVIVAAHGFAAQKDFGIEPLIEQFAKKGLAVFSFDYRTFGGSQGASRNVIDVPAILEDWQSAVTHVLTNGYLFLPKCSNLQLKK
jgi:dipeptidyl aminopeptidase/acylaminoacyl peptidase